MDYQETLEYLYNSLPVFQRIGGAAYKANLENTIALDNHLGNPHHAFKSVHIAGTNGKGSVSQMIYEALRASGYRVGLYTSPHLRDFRERIIVDDTMIPLESVVEFVEANHEFIESLKPSFFEVTVAMAFDYFRRSGVEYAVVEVGMGGRLDSTNIITPLLSIITNIDYDHMQFLGDTLPDIAAEKAGIIKECIPVVIGESTPQTATVFIDRAHKAYAPIHFADQRYRCDGHRENIFTVRSLTMGHTFDIELGMSGDYQQRNICTALAALDILSEQIELHPESVRQGLARAQVRGRWYKLADRPLTICDTGHNRAGIKYVAEQISRQSFEKLYIVLGMVADKDVDSVLELLPTEAHYIFTKADIQRAMPADELALRAGRYSLTGCITQSVAQAMKTAREMATERDMIFVGGSTFVVAEVV